MYYLLRTLLLAVTCLTALIISANAQIPSTINEEASKAAQSPGSPQLQVPSPKSAPRVANRTALYCAGYIQVQKFPHLPEIVGAEEEQEQHTFSEGDVIYIGAGSQQGIRAGQEFQIIRPRGDVKGVYRQKQGFLGTYVQEVGQLQVLKVRENTSVAQITFSCEAALLGDLLMEIPLRESPLAQPESNLDRFADPTGKQTGRLMMARDGREMVTRNDIVYIDLGAEDNIKRGDYLTIYRPLGTGNLTRVENEETVRGRTNGFQSERYRGGGFGIQAQRAKDTSTFGSSEGRYRYQPITTREIKRQRPPMPRKIVGEMVVIDVQSRTATAIITQVVMEVHTGDWVEVK
jgi:hypothetical protein